VKEEGFSAYTRLVTRFNAILLLLLIDFVQVLIEGPVFFVEMLRDTYSYFYNDRRCIQHIGLALPYYINCLRQNR